MKAEFSLRRFENSEHTAGTTQVKQATAAGGDVLVVASAGTEEVAELVVASTEALRRCEALEPTHTSRAPFHAPVVLLQSVILVGAGPVLAMAAERPADRSRVGAVPVGGDLVGCHARDRLGRAEEGLGRRHIPVLAQHGVHEMAVAVDGPIQVGPPATNLQVRLIHVPAAAAGTALATAALAEFVGQCRRELRLPLAEGLVAEHDAAEEEHLGQVAQGQGMRQPRAALRWRGMPAEMAGMTNDVETAAPLGSGL